jgi:hypothetical protein
MKTSSCSLEAHHQSIMHRYMDKLHLFRSTHLRHHGACSGLNPYTGHTIASSRQHKESRSGHPSSSHRLEHRAPLHRQHPLIKTQLTTTPSSREVPVGTPPIRVASSSWWPRPEHICRTTPVGIESTSRPPSGFWCLNDKTIKELMTFAKCETVKISYELH